MHFPIAFDPCWAPNRMNCIDTTRWYLCEKYATQKARRNEISFLVEIKSIRHGDRYTTTLRAVNIIIHINSWQITYSMVNMCVTCHIAVMYVYLRTSKRAHYNGPCLLKTVTQRRDESQEKYVSITKLQMDGLHTRTIICKLQTKIILWCVTATTRHERKNHMMRQ